ncbi:MAG TPA: hypothetical protein VF443_01805 [Nitrospira sp.]
MSPYDILQKNLKDLSEDRDRILAQIEEIESQISLYDTARTKRPKDVPADWEPVLDGKGVLKGWMAPDYALRML